MIIFLVGLPGSGKSTLGSRLAEALNYTAMDLDLIIEEKQGKSIAKIFEEDGEEAFRESERKALLDLNNRVDTVVSTGGGTPCFHANMKSMNQIGITVFLDTSINEISARLKKVDLDKRPLLKGLSQEQTSEYLLNLRNERLRYYLQSTYVLSDDALSFTQLVDMLKN